MFTPNWFLDAPAALVSKLTENPQLNPSRVRNRWDLSRNWVRILAKCRLRVPMV